MIITASDSKYKGDKGVVTAVTKDSVGDKCNVKKANGVIGVYHARDLKLAEVDTAPKFKYGDRVKDNSNDGRLGTILQVHKGTAGDDFSRHTYVLNYDEPMRAGGTHQSKYISEPNLTKV